MLLPEPIITVVSHHTVQFNKRSANALRISGIRTHVQLNSNHTAQLANYGTTLNSFNVAQVQISAVTDVSNSVTGHWLSVFVEINKYEHGGGCERERDVTIIRVGNGERWQTHLQELYRRLAQLLVGCGTTPYLYITFVCLFVC
jgi:hypothetical protein